MNNTQNLIHFTVNIELNSNNSANFTYFIDNKEVSGGGVVRTETAGIYSLNETTLGRGFLFTGATITDKEGDCAGDFTSEVNDDGQSITITDSHENNGTVCLIFNVVCKGKAYESADPQVENEKEINNA
ncbi:DP-EP family protein [Pseudoalteromonas ostreae]|uniref:DP-EP family protein n=1 Tax=Pseudoalteromonas ostreae TaxID=2774154 RepID=UPI001B36A95D|nr:DP-EP family protein [Pseudoalteromonas ostreae]